MKRALITGITGQDGRHLAQFLAGKGYQVFGLIHGQANPKAQLVAEESAALDLVEGDLRDLPSLIAAVEQEMLDLPGQRIRALAPMHACALPGASDGQVFFSGRGWPRG